MVGRCQEGSQIHHLLVEGGSSVVITTPYLNFVLLWLCDPVNHGEMWKDKD